MEILLGWQAGKTNGNPPVYWRYEDAINPHICVVGMTGSGKSYTLRKIISSLSNTSSEKNHKIHIFDVHSDLNIPDASSVLFSEQTQYGLNPFTVCPDPNFGGIRKKTNSFINILKKYSRALGEKQIAVLRNILYDTYNNFGFKLDDPNTWIVTDKATYLPSGYKFYIKVPKEDFSDVQKLGASWDPERRSFWVTADNYSDTFSRWPPNALSKVNPTLLDVLAYAQHINKCAFLGVNSQACTKLEIVHKLANQMFKKRISSHKTSFNSSFDTEQNLIEKAKEKAIRSYAEYVGSIVSGQEIEYLLKYDSSDILMSIVNRLENLKASGIFKNNEPPFDKNKKIWRYDIRALNSDERSMFIQFKCHEIFENALIRGQTDKIYDTIVIDEAHMILDGESDNIIRTIALEGRKFGIQLILASQSPEHFPKDIMTAIATKLVLGLDELLWKTATNKMNITSENLKWIIVHKRYLVQIKTIGQNQSWWNFVYQDKNTFIKS